MKPSPPCTLNGPGPIEKPMPDLPLHASLQLTMRPCVIGGETAPDDWEVICDGVSVGRITKGYMPPDGNAWNWSITCHLFQARQDHSGRAASLDEAKRDWKAKWDEVDPDIETERRLHANYAERMARIGKPVHE